MRGTGLVGLGLGSAELVQEGRQASAECGGPGFQFTDQAPSRRGEGATQLRLIEGADQSLGERVGHRAGEAVDAAPFAGVSPQAQAGEFEDVFADATDPVFGLPEPVALDARVCVQDIEPAQPDEGGRARLGRGWHLLGGAEEGPEVGAASAEVFCRCRCHVDLQTTGRARNTREILEPKGRSK